MVNIVMTRAASKRAAAQKEEDERATVASEAVITDLTQVPELPEVSEESHPQKTPTEHPTGELLTGEGIPLGRPQFLRAQGEDEELKPLYHRAETETEGPYRIHKGALTHSSEDELGHPRLLLVVPRKLRQIIFRAAHSHPLAGHFSVNKVREKIAREFHWPGMAKDVATWTKLCEVCQKNNIKRPPKAPLVLLPAHPAKDMGT